MNRQGSVAESMERAVAALTRRPGMGLQDDTGATARWQGGTHATARHPSGALVDTDMPRELGGGGAHPSPGWFFRAGIANCGATAICMVAASEGIELDELEVRVDSRSDTRGMLGMSGADGMPVHPGPVQMSVAVRIRARGVDATRLRALANEGLRRSPMQGAVLQPVPVQVDIDASSEGA